MMTIEFANHPSTADIDFMTQKINEEIEGFGSAHSFAFFIRDEAGNIIAGCHGSVIFGCIYTDQLWVDKEFRKSGLGSKLMKAVHAYGIQNECAMATVATMSFQGAKAFYQKLGYEVDFERDGYAEGSRCLFLRKDLGRVLK